MLSPEEKAIRIEEMHVACRKIRLAIAVLDADVPPDESTLARLDEAALLIQNVRKELVAVVNEAIHA